MEDGSGTLGFPSGRVVPSKTNGLSGSVGSVKSTSKGIRPIRPSKTKLNGPSVPPGPTSVPPGGTPGISDKVSRNPLPIIASQPEGTVASSTETDGEKNNAKSNASTPASVVGSARLRST